MNNYDYTNNAKSFEQLFDTFIQSNTSKSIKQSFENLADHLDINLDSVYTHGFKLNASNRGFTNRHSLTPSTTTRLIYKIIKSKTNYWKSNELWKKYDKKANSKEYLNKSQNSSEPLNVLIIGCGPVGLRLSIECALLGFKCTIVEKRDRFSRNNVLHLWPFTIQDLKSLGAKLFYGKFCAGSIDHISIRKLQCVLLKCALLLGVNVHFNTSFEEILEPSENDPFWRIKCIPENHSVTKESFNAIIGADGRRNSLPGFNRKEFRGRLAIGITANFINYNTAEEAEVQERSGVAFIFDQKFFLDLKQETKIDLENIVYYKDDTHYFVMTAKRQSLFDKGVLYDDFSDPNLLLSKQNVNFENLCMYAKEAAYNSTNKKLYRLDFAKNHYGQPDVAMFDFTSLFHSENASRIVVRKGRKFLMSLVGDSLLEPFWPLGTGIARGFLAVFDTAWQLKGFANDLDPLELLHERENIYQLLSQTTHDNISKNYQEFTIDPTTRYVNLNLKQMKKTIDINDMQLRALYDTSTSPIYSNTLIKKDSSILMNWAQIIVQPYSLKIENFQSSWQDALVYLAILNRYRPDLINYASLQENNQRQNWLILFNLIETKLGLLEIGDNLKKEFLNDHHLPSKSSVLYLLDKIYNYFKNEPILDMEQNENIEMEINVDANKNSKEDGVMSGLKRRGSLVKSALFQNRINFFNNNALQQGIGEKIKCQEKLTQIDSQFYCYKCNERVFQMDRMNLFDDVILHVNCFKCEDCDRPLRTIGFNHLISQDNNKYLFYCTSHGVNKKERDVKLDENNVDFGSLKRNFDLRLRNKFNQDKYYEHNDEDELDECRKYSPRKQENLTNLKSDIPKHDYLTDLQRENFQKRSEFYSNTYNKPNYSTNTETSNYSTPNTSFTSPSNPTTPNIDDHNLKERAEFESILETDEFNKDEDDVINEEDIDLNNVFSDSDEEEEIDESDEEFFSLDTKYITLRNNQRVESPIDSKSKSRSPFSQSSSNSDINNKIIDKQLDNLVDVYLIRKRAQEKAKLKSDEELGINSKISIKKVKLTDFDEEDFDEVHKENSVEIKRTSLNYQSAPLAKCETLEEDDDSFILLEQPKKKLIKPNLKLSSSSNESFSDDDLSSSSLIDSFNALNVENSPRLNSKKSPFYKKRVSNEERKLEKQKQDKRLRMSQELQRKHDELTQKIDEFTITGANLENRINNLDKKSFGYELVKKSLESKLYDVRHKKNVLIRIENELVIQSQALAIEDKLSECRGKLKETIDLPEELKTNRIKETEKCLMEKLVDLIEAKNNLVEQLEILKLMESEEDKHVLDILAKETNQDFKSSSNDLLDEFKSFNDII
ncbi:unnamed protein product [Brachionus calyciflorus]|uniref:F-actin monooxygenase n=1 Tax=Brachionus calyciflorus TaxID=104777 RepID=A0A814EAC0_9BILA|nr:unnamed protein product [Brachionus calyciflorus]